MDKPNIILNINKEQIDAFKEFIIEVPTEKLKIIVEGFVLGTGMICSTIIYINRLQTN